LQVAAAAAALGAVDSAALLAPALAGAALAAVVGAGVVPDDFAQPATIRPSIAKTATHRVHRFRCMTALLLCRLSRPLP
jgi:hypothetical protein